LNPPRTVGRDDKVDQFTAVNRDHMHLLATPLRFVSAIGRAQFRQRFAQSLPDGSLYLQGPWLRAATAV